MSTASLPRLQVNTVGAVSSQLTSELSPYVDLTTEPSGDGTLFDGTGEVERAGLADALGSGSPIIVARPNAAYQAALLEMTGVAPGADLAAAIYRRSGGAFVCQTIEKRTNSRIIVSEPFGMELARALPEGSFDSVTPPSTMFANAGSVAGYAVAKTFTHNFQINAPVCVWGSSTIDDRLIQASQPAAYSATVVLYVYYVNAPQNPYFAVFATLSSTTACTPVSAANTNLGWFSPMSRLSLTGPSIPAATSPLGGSAANSTVFLQDSFTLIGNTDAGDGNPYQFNPSISEQYSFADWAYLQQGSADSTIWSLYQTTPWNPLFYSFQAYPQWYSTNNVLFDPTWNLMTMSDLALGPYSWQVMAEWYVNIPGEPPTSTAPSTPFTLSINVDPNWFAAHNKIGCLGVCTTTEYEHLFYAPYDAQGINYKITVDIGKIANSRNLTQVAAPARSRS